MPSLSFHSASALALAAVAFMGVSGCDAGDDGRTDAELIVGTWDAETFNARTIIPLVGSVPVVDLESGGDEAAFIFEADGGYTFRFEPADGRTFEIEQAGIVVPLSDVTLTGSYTLDEGSGRIALTDADVPGGLTLDYDLDGDDLELIAEDPETLALLIGLASDDPIVTTLATVVTGGSIALRRDD